MVKATIFWKPVGGSLQGDFGVMSKEDQLQPSGGAQVASRNARSSAEAMERSQKFARLALGPKH